MEAITLDAEVRGTGKHDTRVIRQQGNVPCVLYGNRVEPVHFQVPILALRPLIFTNEAHRVSLTVDGEQWNCILKHVDFHPVTDVPIHVDFQVLVPGRKVRLTIPLKFTGTPRGVQAGGNSELILTEVNVKCLPEEIRPSIDVDIAWMQVGDSIHIGDLGIEGLEFLHPDRQTVITVVSARAMVEEEVEEGEEGLEGEEGVEGEAEGVEASAEEADA